MVSAFGLGTQNYAFQQSVDLDPASVPAGALQAETFSVPGLMAGQAVVVNKLTNNDGVALVSARVSAADTLELTFFNATGGAVNMDSQAFLVIQL